MVDGQLGPLIAAVRCGQAQIALHLPDAIDVQSTSQAHSEWSCQADLAINCVSIEGVVQVQLDLVPVP